MKLTNRTIYNSINSLSELRKANLPIKISAKISKTSKALAEQYKFIEEQRVDLVKKHGKENEDGTFTVSDHNSFWKEFNELLDMEEDIDVRILNIDEFPESVSITTEQYELLSFMFEE